MRILNYNKTVFCSATDPAGRAHDGESDEEMIGLLPPLLLRYPRAPRIVLFLNWYPNFLDQSYAPGNLHVM